MRYRLQTRCGPTIVTTRLTWYVSFGENQAYPLTHLPVQNSAPRIPTQIRSDRPVLGNRLAWALHGLQHGLRLGGGTPGRPWAGGQHLLLHLLGSQQHSRRGVVFFVFGFCFFVVAAFWDLKHTDPRSCGFCRRFLRCFRVFGTPN